MMVARIGGELFMIRQQGLEGGTLSGRARFEESLAINANFLRDTSGGIFLRGRKERANLLPDVMSISILQEPC